MCVCVAAHPEKYIATTFCKKKRLSFEGVRAAPNFLQTNGQRNCSLKDEEFSIIIGKYRMTSGNDLISFDVELNSSHKHDANNNPKFCPQPICNALKSSEEMVFEEIENGVILGEQTTTSSACQQIEINENCVSSSPKVEDGLHDSLEGQKEDILSEDLRSTPVQKTIVQQNEKSEEFAEITTFETSDSKSASDVFESLIDFSRETEKIIQGTEVTKESASGLDWKCSVTEGNSVNGDITSSESNNTKICNESSNSKNNSLKSSLPSKTKTNRKKSTEPSTTENKIALEIREMREREEELRLMREKMATIAMVNVEPVRKLSNSSNVSAKSEDSLDRASDKHELRQPSDGKCNGRLSNNQLANSFNNPNGYNVAYVFSSRKKENIKVKPLVENGNKGPNYKVLNETPVEREIRIVKEREEERRREQLALMSSSGNLDEPKHFTSTSNGISNGNHCVVRDSNNLEESPCQMQRQLATTRIQQEIEEQIRRENDLKALGSIQTTSQERTDCNVTEFNDSTNGNHSVKVDRTVPEPSLSECNSLSSLNSFSSTNSNGSSWSNPVGNRARRFSTNPSRNKNVSMTRFIASKGKEVGLANNHTKYKSHSFDYMDIKPPQLRKGDILTHKRAASAESKIQEELREMKAREEELKEHRANLLRLSQPDLRILGDDRSLDGESDEEVDYQQPLAERCSSNPNLLEVDASWKPRRRSVLIDQWEQRIQKLDIPV